MNPVHTLIICSQQDFELHDQLNPIQIKIDDDQIINTLKKYKVAFYKFTSTSLFSSSIKNDTSQIFVTCKELNKVKVALINGTILNILGIINLDKINNWNEIKRKSIWTNANFEKLKDKKNRPFFLLLALKHLT